MDPAETRLRRALERVDAEHREKVNAKRTAGIWKARAIYLHHQLEALKTTDAATVTPPDRDHKD